MFLSFTIGPFDIILLLVAAAILFAYSTYIIFRNETGLVRFMWIMANILLFPIVPVVYIIMTKLLNNKKLQS